MERISPESYKFGREAVVLYRAIDDFARAEDEKDGDAPLSEFVDIDVAPAFGEAHKEDANRIISWEDARERLADLEERIPDSEPETAKADIRSSIYFFDQVLGHTESDFISVIQRTLGVTPKPAGETRKKALAADLDALLSEVGLGFDQRYGQQFRDRFVLKDSAELSAHLISSYRVSVRGLRRYFSIAPLVTRPTIVEKKEPWTGYFSTDEKRRPFYHLNADPSKEVTSMRIDGINPHEATHGINARGIMLSIANGWLSPLFGVQKLFTPSCTQAEALALAGERLILRDRGPWEHTFQGLWNELYDAIYHDAQLRVNTGEDIDRVAEDVIEWSPLEDYDKPEKREDLRKELLQRRDNPLFRVCLTAYEPALKIIRPIFDMPLERQRQIVHTLATTALTPSGIEALVGSTAA